MPQSFKSSGRSERALGFYLTNASAIGHCIGIICVIRHLNKAQSDAEHLSLSQEKSSGKLLKEDLPISDWV
jgi:hypothetical protein